MKQEFLSLTKSEQTQIYGGDTPDRACHDCGGSNLLDLHKKDMWGYNLFECQDCQAICEYWW